MAATTAATPAAIAAMLRGGSSLAPDAVALAIASPALALVLLSDSMVFCFVAIVSVCLRAVLRAVMTLMVCITVVMACIMLKAVSMVADSFSHTDPLPLSVSVSCVTALMPPLTALHACWLVLSQLCMLCLASSVSTSILASMGLSPRASSSLLSSAIRRSASSLPMMPIW